MKLTSIALALVLWLSSGLRADVTIRYQSEFKPSAALQPILEQVMKSVETGSTSSVRMKGNKAYTTSGNWIQIFDFAKQEVTLVDSAHKTYAAFPISQFADQMAGAIPQATSEQMKAAQQALASVKSSVDSKMTGNTAEIQGIQAEERQVTLTMELPMPTTNQSSAGIKMAMHIWTPKKEEVLRVPAIRELTGYQAWQRYVINPVGILDKLLGKMPGMSDSIGSMFDEIYKNPSVILRMRVEIYVPFLAVLAKQMAAQGSQVLPAMDPDAPIMEIDQEVAELSSAPVDASQLEIPAGYTAVAAADLLQAMIKPQK
jgi:hypothetical protein